MLGHHMPSNWNGPIPTRRSQLQSSMHIMECGGVTTNGDIIGKYILSDGTAVKMQSESRHHDSLSAVSQWNVMWRSIYIHKCVGPPLHVHSWLIISEMAIVWTSLYACTQIVFLGNIRVFSENNKVYVWCISWSLWIDLYHQLLTNISSITAIIVYK